MYSTCYPLPSPGESFGTALYIISEGLNFESLTPVHQNDQTIIWECFPSPLAHTPGSFSMSRQDNRLASWF
uniref:Uncharacterized protein n=1 Tax=Rhizophora mucronata TaxID=61149 RepID=A0A2P2LRS8_RHIMU